MGCIMDKWEYKAVYMEKNHVLIEEQLDAYGNKGWELVTVVKYDKMHNPWLYYFKRIKDESSVQWRK